MSTYIFKNTASVILANVSISLWSFRYVLHLSVLPQNLCLSAFLERTVVLPTSNTVVYDDASRPKIFIFVCRWSLQNRTFLYLLVLASCCLFDGIFYCIKLLPMFTTLHLENKTINLNTYFQKILHIIATSICLVFYHVVFKEIR